MVGESYFRAGSLVEVLPKAHILATLDENGALEGMPFMPEMLQFCGRQFRVAQVAHKSCDTIHYSGIRRMRNAVHLEGLRCDGSAHGGCQAACLLFWKDAWLKPVSDPDGSNLSKNPISAGITEGELDRAVVRGESSSKEPVYRCQVTEILRASTQWRWWDPRQYWLDVRLGNTTSRHAVIVLLLAALRALIRRTFSIRIASTNLISLYNRVARREGFHEYGDIADMSGPIQAGESTPGSDFVPKTGDWVRIKPRSEIISTLDTTCKNKGMHFDPEMVRYCDSSHRVADVVEKIINEESGRMMHFRNPCIRLEGVDCKGEYSGQRLLCPRAITPYWRPVWLESSSERHDADNLG